MLSFIGNRFSLMDPGDSQHSARNPGDRPESGCGSESGYALLASCSSNSKPGMRGQACQGWVEPNGAGAWQLWSPPIRVNTPFPALLPSFLVFPAILQNSLLWLCLSPPLTRLGGEGIKCLSLTGYLMH